MKFFKKIIKKKSSNKLMTTVLLAAVFGLVGGISGQIFFNAYILDEYYQLPYLGEINLKNGTPGGSLVIRDARKVVVEQDDKIQETINSSDDAIVGIFRKKTAEKNSGKTFDIDDYYKKEEERGQGIIITSDGWILTSAFSPVIRTENDILANYAVITQDKKIYEIDKVLREPTSNFGFLHIKNVSDLNVSKFELSNKLTEGQQVISINWDGESLVSKILNSEKSEKAIKSSDQALEKILLTSELSENFKGSPVFDLSGFVVGVIDNKGEIEKFNNYIPEIKSLLKFEEIRRAKLGVNYINLSDFVITDKNYEKGALITKNEAGVAVEDNSPADIAGLQEGDIILSVDNIEINSTTNLTQALQNYLAGDIINLSYFRDGQRYEVKVQLASLE